MNYVLDRLREPSTYAGLAAASLSAQEVFAAIQAEIEAGGGLLQALAIGGLALAAILKRDRS